MGWRNRDQNRSNGGIWKNSGGQEKKVIPSGRAICLTKGCYGPFEDDMQEILGIQCFCNSLVLIHKPCQRIWLEPGSKDGCLKCKPKRKIFDVVLSKLSDGNFEAVRWRHDVARFI
ncbi:hypothetical protein LIER_39830 [Lithospermum erythrorhizon]|uniref:RING-CH-type domain-containing protein n=1 Tax=Lithospermum erythrorhizon TaxID=34254 RepID=A0AAV3QKR9_LITER